MTLSKKLRVLIFHPALAPYRVDLFNELSKRCELRVVFFRKNLLNQKFDQHYLLSRLSCDYAFLTTGFSIRATCIRFGIGREIGLFGPDIVITHEFSPATVNIACRKILTRKDYKHVVWTDDNPEAVVRDSLPRKLARQLLIPRIDGMIFVSNEAVEHYRRHYKMVSQATAVPILQPEDVFRDRLESAGELAERYVVEHKLENRKVFVYVGRLARVKRIDIMLRTFASVIKDSSEKAVLVLVGDGDQRGVLEDLVANLGIQERVIFTGRHEGDELAAWYRVGDIFILTSEFEPFGAVVNEALLSGMPVICTNKAGARILVHDGDNGSVIDPGNDEALRMAMVGWLSQISPGGRLKQHFLRPSLMKIEFKEAVDSFVKLLDGVSVMGNQVNCRNQ